MKRNNLIAATFVFAMCSWIYAQGGGGGGAGTGGTGGIGSETGTGAPGSGAQGAIPKTGYAGGYTQQPWFTDPNARQSLGITNEQYNQLHKSYSNYWRDFTTGLNQFSPDQREKQMSKAVSNFVSQTSKAAQDILKPDQYNRFRQMEMQYRGWNSFNDPQVQKELNLTQQQREQLQTYQNRWNQTMNQVYSSTPQNREAAMKSYQDARLQYDKQVQQFLTPEQRRAWAQMMGDPYEFRPYWDQAKQPATQQPIPQNR
ncbi:MAG: hypothetical protein U0744_17520 [Gemmataceae bacterium]